MEPRQHAVQVDRVEQSFELRPVQRHHVQVVSVLTVVLDHQPKDTVNHPAGSQVAVEHRLGSQGRIRAVGDVYHADGQFRLHEQPDHIIHELLDHTPVLAG